MIHRLLRGHWPIRKAPPWRCIVCGHLLALVFAASAAADGPSPTLGAIATRYVGHPVTVSCVRGLGGGASSGWLNTVWIEDHFCSPLRAMSGQVEVTPVRQGIGLIILTHEAIHQRGTANEAKTECLAFQQVDEMMSLFGPFDARWTALVLGYAYRDHRRLIREVPRYRDSQRCAPDGVWDLTAGDGIWP